MNDVFVRLINLENPMGSILLKNGTIVDGLGTPGFAGSLLIEGDRIKKLFKEGENLPQADSVIDASGRSIAPGFIDMHSHVDWILALNDHPNLLKCLVEQGITTVVAGNCGLSPAPVRPNTRKRLERLASIVISRPLDYSWDSIAGFLSRIEENKPLVNLAQLVGHSSTRIAAAETRRGLMKSDELQKCLALTCRSLDEGACGLSFGLGYNPGMFSPLDELAAFCRAAAQANKPATVHLKAYSWVSPCYPITTFRSHNLLALKEMLDIARRTNVKLQVSHFMTVGRRSWSTASAWFKQFDNVRSQGLDVMMDCFPYTSGTTTILVLVPYWFLAKIPQGYRSGWARARLRAELELGFQLMGTTFQDFQIIDSAVPGWENLNGLTIAEAGAQWNISPFEAFLRLAEQSRGATLMFFNHGGEEGNEGPINTALAHEACLFETDAIIRDTGHPNPASVGTFPKILGLYVRERKLFSLENAIQRMTSKSAERFGLKDRGVLAPGKAADVVVFDPETISDTPPIGNQPAGKPRGIEHVFINGVQVVKDGSYLKEIRPGRILRT